MPLYSPGVGPTLIIPSCVAGLPPNAAAWPAVNRALFMRFQLGITTVFRYVNWVVSVQSGNVQIGVVALSGANRLTYTRVMDSGVIACPAAADQHTDLGATLLPAGDYATFLWADNVTFQTRFTSAANYSPTRTTGTLSGAASGVQTTGTIAWSNQAAFVGLEGDV